MLYLFETKTFFSKSCKLFLNAHFLENKLSNKLPLGLCRLVFKPFVEVSSRRSVEQTPKSSKAQLHVTGWSVLSSYFGKLSEVVLICQEF